jgi:hypothetical protein
MWAAALGLVLSACCFVQSWATSLDFPLCDAPLYVPAVEVFTLTTNGRVVTSMTPLGAIQVDPTIPFKITNRKGETFTAVATSSMPFSDGHMVDPNPKDYYQRHLRGSKKSKKAPKPSPSPPPPSPKPTPKPTPMPTPMPTPSWPPSPEDDGSDLRGCVIVIGSSYYAMKHDEDDDDMNHPVPGATSGYWEIGDFPPRVEASSDHVLKDGGEELHLVRTVMTISCKIDYNIIGDSEGNLLDEPYFGGSAEVKGCFTFGTTFGPPAPCIGGDCSPPLLASCTDDEGSWLGGYLSAGFCKLDEIDEKSRCATVTFDVNASGGPRLVLTADPGVTVRFPISFGALPMKCDGNFGSLDAGSDYDDALVFRQGLLYDNSPCSAEGIEHRTCVPERTLVGYCHIDGQCPASFFQKQSDFAFKLSCVNYKGYSLPQITSPSGLQVEFDMNYAAGTVIPNFCGQPVDFCEGIKSAFGPTPYCSGGTCDPPGEDEASALRSCEQGTWGGRYLSAGNCTPDTFRHVKCTTVTVDTGSSQLLIELDPDTELDLPLRLGALPMTCGGIRAIGPTDAGSLYDDKLFFAPGTLYDMSPCPSRAFEAGACVPSEPKKVIGTCFCEGVCPGYYLAEQPPASFVCECLDEMQKEIRSLKAETGSGLSAVLDIGYSDINLTTTFCGQSVTTLSRRISSVFGPTPPCSGGTCSPLLACVEAEKWRRGHLAAGTCSTNEFGFHICSTVTFDMTVEGDPQLVIMADPGATIQFPVAIGALPMFCEGNPGNIGSPDSGSAYSDKNFFSAGTLYRRTCEGAPLAAEVCSNSSGPLEAGSCFCHGQCPKYFLQDQPMAAFLCECFDSEQRVISSLSSPSGLMATFSASSGYSREDVITNFCSQRAEFFDSKSSPFIGSQLGPTSPCDAGTCELDADVLAECQGEGGDWLPGRLTAGGNCVTDQFGFLSCVTATLEAQQDQDYPHFIIEADPGATLTLPLTINSRPMPCQGIIGSPDAGATYDDKGLFVEAKLYHKRCTGQPLAARACTNADGPVEAGLCFCEGQCPVFYLADQPPSAFVCKCFAVEDGSEIRSIQGPSGLIADFSMGLPVEEMGQQFCGQSIGFADGSTAVFTKTAIGPPPPCDAGTCELEADVLAECQDEGGNWKMGNLAGGNCIVDGSGTEMCMRATLEVSGDTEFPQFIIEADPGSTLKLPLTINSRPMRCEGIIGSPAAGASYDDKGLFVEGLLYHRKCEGQPLASGACTNTAGPVEAGTCFCEGQCPVFYLADQPSSAFICKCFAVEDGSEIRSIQAPSGLLAAFDMTLTKDEVGPQFCGQSLGFSDGSTASFSAKQSGPIPACSGGTCDPSPAVKAACQDGLSKGWQGGQLIAGTCTADELGYQECLTATLDIANSPPRLVVRADPNVPLHFPLQVGALPMDCGGSIGPTAAGADSSDRGFFAAGNLYDNSPCTGAAFEAGTCIPELGEEIGPCYCEGLCPLFFGAEQPEAKFSCSCFENGNAISSRSSESGLVVEFNMAADYSPDEIFTNFCGQSFAFDQCTQSAFAPTLDCDGGECYAYLLPSCAANPLPGDYLSASNCIADEIYSELKCTTVTLDANSPQLSIRVDGSRPLDLPIKIGSLPMACGGTIGPQDAGALHDHRPLFMEGKLYEIGQCDQELANCYCQSQCAEFMTPGQAPHTFLCECVAADSGNAITSIASPTGSGLIVSFDLAEELSFSSVMTNFCGQKVQFADDSVTPFSTTSSSEDAGLKFYLSQTLGASCEGTASSQSWESKLLLTHDRVSLKLQDAGVKALVKVPVFIATERAETDPCDVDGRFPFMVQEGAFGFCMNPEVESIYFNFVAQDACGGGIVTAYTQSAAQVSSYNNDFLNSNWGGEEGEALQLCGDVFEDALAHFFYVRPHLRAPIPSRSVLTTMPRMFPFAFAAVRGYASKLRCLQQWKHQFGQPEHYCGDHT